MNILIPGVQVEVITNLNKHQYDSLLSVKGETQHSCPRKREANLII